MNNINPFWKTVAVGAPFGDWVVIGPPERIQGKQNTEVYFPCRCVCGTERLVRDYSLKGGASVNCGCALRQKTIARNTTHGHSTENLYNRFRSLQGRCRNPKNKSFLDYGGRGIFVCDEWKTYGAFREWALNNGFTEDKEIDRIDNDGPYSPDNCRWVSKTHNLRNNRHNNMITAWGETKCLSAWMEDSRCGVQNKISIRKRLAKGFTPEEAIGCPPSK